MNAPPPIRVGCCPFFKVSAIKSEAAAISNAIRDYSFPLSIVNEHFNDVDEKDEVRENLKQIWSLPVRWPTPLLGSAHFKDSQLFCRFVVYGTEYV